MHEWIPAGLRRRYAEQRRVHHEARSGRHYLWLILLAVGAIIAAALTIPLLADLTTAQNTFESATGTTIQRFTLSQSQSSAAQLLARWQPHPEIFSYAREVVARDDAFIFPYTLGFWLFASWACGFAYFWAPARPDPHSHRKRELFHWGGLMATAALLAGADVGENYFLGQMLVTRSVGDLQWLRLFAQAKFAFLALLLLGSLIALAIGLRREMRFWNAAAEPDALAENPGIALNAFRDLIIKEQSGIARCRGYGTIGPEIQTETSGEPRVIQSRMDCVGLALSGGGIRSATFNAGLLQGLHRFDLLRHVDYLATVSGGGYIGGFWSRWLKESEGRRAAAGIFPDQYRESMKNFSGDSRVFESPEVRHLREFSKFLVPRTGIFDTETWGAVVAMLASVIPALLAALSVLGLSLIAWLLLTFYLACPEPWGRVSAGVLVTAAVLIGMEIWWRRMPTGDPDPRNRRRVERRTYVALILFGLIAACGADDSTLWMYSPASQVWYWRSVPANYQNWWTLVGIYVEPLAFAQGKLLWIPALYEPSLAWMIVGMVFLACRFRGVLAASSMERRTALPTNDRVAMRLFGLASLWALIATFWHIGLNIRNYESLSAYLGAGAAGSAGIFALLRNWISQKLPRPQRKGGWWDSVRPFIPQVLAYLAIGLAWAAMASKLIEIDQHDWFRWYATALVLSLPIIFALLVDPQEFGLHAVYRDRICRAYLGAASPSAQSAAQNRKTDLRKDDDVPLDSLLERPLHLICCAANNVGGDHLSTLSRGARSAVLSRHGVAMGDRGVAQPGLSLGSALTASAAAANSNMGSLSMTVGPAVSFLMTALNLRLGLWVDNPKITDTPRRDRWLPGWRYFKEMIAWTDTDSRDIHLSDGGHFDNLGLYELVRRHCRYIILSDCGADPKMAFGDFGNAVRRIREDFGVEIDIDITPLKPGADGFVRQHAAVGVIDYGWFDKGVLVYIKASLTGDETVDTVQYKSGKQDFPHETTGDQFYDEAQWESYRRLGVHTINQVFSFVEHIAVDSRDRVRKVFSEARRVWSPLPPGLSERSLQMTERLSQLEKDLKADGGAPMLGEIFPEIEHFGQRKAPAAQRADAWKDEAANLHLLLRVLTLMEDVILACELTERWAHPVNLGWVNLFARWATAPTFRQWWPLLKPLYGPALREFLEDRFIVLRDSQAVAGAVSEVLSESDWREGFAVQWWRTRYDAHWRIRNGTRPAHLFQYKAVMSGGAAAWPRELQLALVWIKTLGDTAVWTNERLFVPLSLWGSSLAAHFLERLLDCLRRKGIKRCVVMIKGPSQMENNLARWEERQKFVDYYRRAGFRVERVTQYSEPDAHGERRSGKLAVLMLELD